ncbi:UNVERIFIED_CONTAM: hypothetical protein Slati_4475800, partial [Sesamum latifolium]
ERLRPPKRKARVPDAGREEGRERRPRPLQAPEVLLLPNRKGQRTGWGSQRSKKNNVCMHCQGKGHWKIECPQLLSNPGTFVVEVNMISSSASWVLDTGCGAHICNNLQVLERSRKLSNDEMVLRLGDGKAVAAEGVGSLSLVVSNHVSGPLSIPARGGFSYFITFTDDHSRYGYVYLIKYKSEVFERFKEYRLEIETKLTAKIKALRSSRRFIEYSKETAGYYFYDPAEQKVFISRNAVFLGKDFPLDNRRDEVLIEESSKEPHRDSTTSFEPSVHTDGVPVLRRSTRESRAPERWIRGIDQSIG